MEKIQVSDEELERELQVISLQTREPLENLRDRLTREGSLDRSVNNCGGKKREMFWLKGCPEQRAIRRG